MGRLLKLKEASMADNGQNPLNLVGNKCQALVKAGKMSDGEMGQIKGMMKNFSMGEEDNSDFLKAINSADCFDGMKKAIEKYVK